MGAADVVEVSRGPVPDCLGRVFITLLQQRARYYWKFEWARLPCETYPTEDERKRVVLI